MTMEQEQSDEAIRQALGTKTDAMKQYFDLAKNLSEIAKYEGDEQVKTELVISMKLIRKTYEF